MNKKNADTSVWISPINDDRYFRVQFRGDHVHVTLGKGLAIMPGQHFDFWEEIRRVCEEHGSRRVLVEGNFPKGERSTTEVIEAGQRTSTVPQLWLAFHIDNYVPNEQSELYAVIAASRGVRVRYFNDAEHALAWLRSNTTS